MGGKACNFTGQSTIGLILRFTTNKFFCKKEKIKYLKWCFIGGKASKLLVFTVKHFDAHNKEILKDH